MQYLGILFLILVALVGMAQLATAAATASIIALAAILYALVKAKYPLVYFSSISLSLVFCFVWGFCITCWIAFGSFLINDFLYQDEFFAVVYNKTNPEALDFYRKFTETVPKVSLALFVTYLTRRSRTSGIVFAVVQPAAVLAVMVFVEGGLNTSPICNVFTAASREACTGMGLWDSVLSAARSWMDPVLAFFKRLNSDPLLIGYFWDQIAASKGNLFNAIPLLSLLVPLVMLFRSALLLFGTKERLNAPSNKWSWPKFISFAAGASALVLCVWNMIYVNTKDWSGPPNFGDAMLGLSVIPTLIGAFALPFILTIVLFNLTSDKSSSGG